MHSARWPALNVSTACVPTLPPCLRAVWLWAVASPSTKCTHHTTVNTRRASWRFQLATLPRSILSFEEQMAAFEEVMRADRHRAEEASAERWLDRDSMRGL